MRKSFLICLLLVAAMFVLSPLETARAAEPSGGSAGSGEVTPSKDCDGNFLTFPAWYNGIAGVSNTGVDKGRCVIVSPSVFNTADNTGGFKKFIWIIVLNIIEILLNLVGYASVIFIIYGGYKYIYSAGSPNGMVSARKTIMNAVIGLVLSILSVGIVNTIAGSLK